MPSLKDLHIRITSNCNFNCRHCYATDWFNDNVSLDLETTLSTIQQAQALGCEKVTFTGGEPLVSKVTAPSMKECLDRGLRVEIETNGMLINKVIPQLTGYLDKIEFSVSYDGENQRNKRSAERVRNNVFMLKDLGCDLQIQTVLTEINIDEVDEMFAFSKAAGARNRVFLAHSPNGNGAGLPLFSVEKWLQILGYLKATYTHLIIELPDVFSGGTQKKCGWGVHRCEIMPNGDVTSCGPITFNKRDYIAGNIKERPLKVIWDAPHFREIRELTQEKFGDLCARCPYWKTCLGACRSIAFATEGMLLSPHPFCAAFYQHYASGTLDPSLLTMVPLATAWFHAIRSGGTASYKEKMSEIVQRQHARVK